MKKLILLLALVIGALTIKSQTLTDLQVFLQPSYPQTDTRVNLMFRWQYDYGDYSTNSTYGFIDSNKVQFRAFSSWVSSVNGNTRLVGTDANGNLSPLDISSLSIPSVAVPHNSVTRAINSATFSIGSKPAWVNYSIRISCNNTLLLSAAGGTVALQYSTNNGSSWNDVSQVENGLNVGIVASNSQAGVLSGYIPASAIVRMNTTIASGAGIGSTTVTYVRGQENY